MSDSDGGDMSDDFLLHLDVVFIYSIFNFYYLT